MKHPSVSCLDYVLNVQAVVAPEGEGMDVEADAMGTQSIGLIKHVFSSHQ